MTWSDAPLFLSRRGAHLFTVPLHWGGHLIEPVPMQSYFCALVRLSQLSSRNKATVCAA